MASNLVPRGEPPAAVKEMLLACGSVKDLEKCGIGKNVTFGGSGIYYRGTTSTVSIST